MRPSRRAFLAALGGAGAAVTVGAGVSWLASPVEIGRQVRSELPLPEPFTVPLPVPPVLTPSAEGDVDRYELTQRVSTVEILPGVPTEIWGYDGRFPGPTIVSRRGRPTVVRHHNQLPVPTVVHLHGGHTPAGHDGYPTDLVLPAHFSPRHGSMRADPRAVVVRGSRTYSYPMRQRAATLWYHDHRMDFTGPAVWRGLFGLHLVHDEEEDALPLPRGDRDLPLIIADRSFAADGSLSYPALDPSLLTTPGVARDYREGVLGDVILVNGAPWPLAEVAAARHRLRILNAANARRYRLALDPQPPGGGGLVQVGSDGGLLDRPVRHDRLDVAPAERFDVVVDFARYRPGTHVTLVNLLGSGTTSRVMRFVVTHAARDDSHVPARLSSIPPPAPAAVTRDLTFRRRDGTWTVNGRPFDPGRTDLETSLGRTEIWRVTTDFAHPIHVHHDAFRVLGRNGHAPGPYDRGWKDTVSVDPTGELTIAVRFTDYPGRFVYHCHNLEHEDMAMMANLELRS